MLEGKRTSALRSVERRAISDYVYVFATYVLSSLTYFICSIDGSLSAEQLWRAELRPPICCASDTKVGEIELSGSVEEESDKVKILGEVRNNFPLFSIIDQMSIEVGGVDYSKADIALTELAKLSLGHVIISSNVLSIKGMGTSEWHSATPDRWPTDAIAAAFTGGLNLGKAEVDLVRTSLPWSISKAENSVVIKGFAPSLTAKNIVLKDVLIDFPTAKIVDDTKIVLGEEAGFTTAANVAVGQLTKGGPKSVSISGNVVNMSVDSSLFNDHGADKNQIFAGFEKTLKTQLPSSAVKVVGVDSSDKYAVSFFYATDRKELVQNGITSYTTDRDVELHYGAVQVHIPIEHVMGHIELPKSTQLFWFLPWGKEKADPRKHFIVNGVEKMDLSYWKEAISQSAGSGILLFVPGFANTFEDSVYRLAQIVADMQFKGTAILFSWPSKGDPLAYEYDRNSALVARSDFVKILQIIQGISTTSSIDLICHSMGNFLSIDALAQITQNQVGHPFVFDQVVLAAADIDIDMYKDEVEKVVKVAKGVTLYASSSDKALTLSQKLAFAPRAGQIIEGSPILAEGVDAIDVTAVGDDMFGIDHDTYASARSVIDDMKLLLKGIRPPDDRLAEIHSMPKGAKSPIFWRYVY